MMPPDLRAFVIPLAESHAAAAAHTQKPALRQALGTGLQRSGRSTALTDTDISVSGTHFRDHEVASRPLRFGTYRECGVSHNLKRRAVAKASRNAG
jgi:hypothetical protein